MICLFPLLSVCFLKNKKTAAIPPFPCITGKKEGLLAFNGICIPSLHGEI
jgi:hypothetical protein